MRHNSFVNRTSAKSWLTRARDGSGSISEYFPLKRGNSGTEELGGFSNKPIYERAPSKVSIRSDR